VSLPLSVRWRHHTIIVGLTGSTDSPAIPAPSMRSISMSRLTALRRHLSYLNWLYNPLRAWDVTEVYDLLATDVATADALYLNLGYWDGAQTLDDACHALARLVADAAEMGPDHQVLDVGFGFADQDIAWIDSHQPRQILGLNVTASQVEVARRRVEASGLSERIDLRVGSATDMPIASASVDRVIALECAFHFRTRERFFAEAFRVLRPGGVLVAADILPMAPAPGWRARLAQRWSWGLVANRFAIPLENVYTRSGYIERLTQAGFSAIAVNSIRDRVYGPLHRYLQDHPETLDRLHPATRLPARLALRLSADRVYAGLDYVLAVAQKPDLAA
jgi:ubiquinone/menaquinone biosynthesis C-methylase UbiE